MDILIWVWVAVACLSALLELASMQLVAVWFTFSSLVAIVLALCGVLWWVQVLVFCVLALALLLALRRFCVRFLLKNDHQKTNIDSLVGTTHKLLESIEPETPGSLKINGVVWTAICDDETKALEKGCFVKVVEVLGNKLVVTKDETKPQQKNLTQPKTLNKAEQDKEPTKEKTKTQTTEAEQNKKTAKKTEKQNQPKKDTKKAEQKNEISAKETKKGGKS